MQFAQWKKKHVKVRAVNMQGARSPRWPNFIRRGQYM